MSDTSKNIIGKPLKVVIRTPQTKGDIDKALQNPDLRRIALLLIENQDDQGFLMNVEGHIKKELEKEVKCHDSNRANFRARRAFWEALKTKVAEQRKGLTSSQFHLFTNRNYPLLHKSERAYLKPILLTDELLELMEKTEVQIKEFSKEEIEKWYDGTIRILGDDIIVWLQKIDGTLIQMVISDKKYFPDHYSFDLKKVVIIGDNEEIQ